MTSLTARLASTTQATGTVIIVPDPGAAARRFRECREGVYSCAGVSPPAARPGSGLGCFADELLPPVGPVAAQVASGLLRATPGYAEGFPGQLHSWPCLDARVIPR